MKICYHCGNEVVENQNIRYDEKDFCCEGCKTVYDLFSSCDLGSYYEFEKHPGSSPNITPGKYDYLDNQEIVAKLLNFAEEQTNIVLLYIPNVHCSSCIWILENLHRLHSGIIASQVTFSTKKVNITFNPQKISLKEVVLLLTKIGYEPYISLENYDQKPKFIDRSLIYKIGVAFFGFGNIMLLSFPEYFSVDDIWMQEYKPFFRYLILLLSLPVFLYSATPYYISAWHSIRTKTFNIDIPMALGIIVMFLRSLFDIFFQDGQGFLDSMCGLVFFMLSGKLVQQTTFNFLSFERDYKSYFPIAVTKIEQNKEVPIQVYEVEKGDIILIRNQELIPVDSILLSDKAYIDYSFVTGEAIPVEKKSGDKIFAGGKQIGNAIRLQSINTVSQSYLTQLWSNDVFQKKITEKFRTVTDRVSKIFTPALLSIALIGFIFWSFTSFNDAFNVATAVLIIACPCAIALTAPYTWGNVIRIMGRQKLYVKNTPVIEQLSKVDTIVFDKTGTITANSSKDINYQGVPLTDVQKEQLKSIVRGSNHPLSRKLYQYLPNTTISSPTSFEEIMGKGIVSVIDGVAYKVGSEQFVGANLHFQDKQTRVFVSINGEYKGYFEIDNQYREGLSELFSLLHNQNYNLYVLSGDNDGEHKQLERILPAETKLVFNQTPEDKLNFIKQLQEQGKNVMMVGDGLNDSGALAQSNIGMSISENVNVFTPASDAILDASQFKNIGYFLQLSKDSMKTISMSYSIALIYNTVGISFALSNKLSPLAAAIIMPLSTVNIISFVTFMSYYFSRKKKFKL